VSRALTVRSASWKLRRPFAIARDVRTHVDTVIVRLDQDGAVGRGECRPYARYDETVESVAADIESVRADVEAGLDRTALLEALPAGAARNAVDCALWDLEAKRTGTPVWRLAGLAAPRPLPTAYTVSLDTESRMAEAAGEAAAAGYGLLKLKLTGDGDLDRVRAVRAAAPAARLIVDANEAWRPADLRPRAEALAEVGVEMIEQPLPAGEDATLDGLESPVTLCADESCHDRSSLDALEGRYAMVNIKLDKAGGLTEALALRAEAEARGFRIMVGCMMAGSLAMAPAMLLAQGAEVVDLDGPLWLAEDHAPPLHAEGAMLSPADPALWG